MEAGTILSADVLDIIFDNRNKEYGAYDLRKHYQRRLIKSLLVTLLVVVLICLTYILLGAMKFGKEKLEVLGVINLQKVDDKVKPPEKIIPPPVKVIPQPAVKMLIYTAPIIEKNPPDIERPPEQKDLDNVKIGTANVLNETDDAGITPPVDINKGISDVPKKLNDDDDGIVRIVEIESEYPGGLSAWSAFLYRNLVYPQDAIDNEKQGTVVVQFIVDKEGNVSDVNAISGPEELRDAAVKVIRKSGKWTAAIQNGRKVKSYKKQPITFKLATDQ